MVWRFIVSFIMIACVYVAVDSTVGAQGNEKRIITVYDRGKTIVFLSQEKTIGEAIKMQNIVLDARDTVEPSLDHELIASEYRVNIYRARPIVVVDGTVRVKTVSPYQTAKQIAKDVDIVVHEEDITKLRPLSNLVNDGAGLQLTIMRSTQLTLDFYGKPTIIRTQAKTVGDMLTEKAITLRSIDRLSISRETPITADMNIRIWREGIQTLSIDQKIPVSNRIIYDSDRPIGFRAIQTKGIPGIRAITYQVDIKDGIEVSRVEIANIVTRNPSEQTEVIGIRNDGAGLTESKGAQYWTDSKAVSHRETYYDLNMRVVMQSCGQGGQYFVRPDGVKVDAQGYVIVAANYSMYPKCSVVETSLGAAKVYDTGGFALKHPYGFDLATDWTRADGI